MQNRGEKHADLHTRDPPGMNHDESRDQLRYDGPTLEEMGVRPQDCGTGHPHIDACVFDLCRLIVRKIEEDPARFQIACENLARERERWGDLTPARREWLDILKRPWPEIRAILLDDSDEGQRLRGSHPFSGLVTDEERDAITARHPPPGAPPDWKPPPAPPPHVLAELLADKRVPG